jgi:hypothetical protein
LVLLRIIFSLIFSFSAWAGLGVAEIDPYAPLEKDKKKDAAETAKDGAKNGKNSIDDKISELKKNEPSLDIPFFCSTAAEFQKTYEDFRYKQIIELPETDIIKLSYEVSKGCNGANERFHKVLSLLLKMGVDKRKAVEVAMHFSKKADAHAEAFILVMKGTFLEKYMDLDFKVALNTSLNLALTAKGDAAVVARDFRAILDYCLANEESGLPFKVCAPYTFELAKYTYLYGNEGLKTSFKRLTDFFREQKEHDYSLANILKLTAKVLSQGPQGVENFENQYRFGVSEKMRLPQKAAIELAVKISAITLAPDKSK